MAHTKLARCPYCKWNPILYMEKRNEKLFWIIGLPDRPVLCGHCKWHFWAVPEYRIFKAIPERISPIWVASEYPPIK